MSERNRSNGGRGYKFALWGIISAAVLVRAVYLIQLGKSDLQWLLPLDMRFYRELAEGLSAGASMPGGALSFNPLYPLILSAIFRVAGNGLLVPRIIQALLGVITIYLHYVAGKDIMKNSKGTGTRAGEQAGIFAAATALLYPHFLLYEASLLATSFVTLIFISSFIIALRIDLHISGITEFKIKTGNGRKYSAGFLLGVLMGIGALGRPNLFFILIPAVIVWLFFRRTRTDNGRKAAVFCFVGTAIILSLPIAFNAVRTGRLIPVTSHGGINFYIGNRPEADGVYKPPDGMRADMRGLLEDAKKRARELSNEELTGEEVSEYWFGRTVDGIREDPSRWLKLLGRKLLLFWNKAEIPDVIDISFYKESCPVMRLLFIPFSFISVLAVMGLAVIFIIRRNRALFTVFTGSSVFSVIIFYINSRYRVVSVPVLILSASVFFSWATHQVRRRRWKNLTLAAFIAPALFFAVVNRDMVQINRSAMYGFLGNQYILRGNEEKAEKAYHRAYQLDPERVEARINYARILSRRGKFGRAITLYESAFKEFPDFPHLALEYAVVLERLGRQEKAVKLFRYAYRVERGKDRVLACKYLSRAALSEGNTDMAVYWIRKALEITPGDLKLVKLLNRLEGGR
ncbi:MAG: tetratricopeptide repeat protein [Candidatus Krumholzibacteriota bacterium]|nr:tetratricopeptide repeat protein [Candidatus Krumholzibacteriota bacterium]